MAAEERLVLFRSRTVLGVLGVVLLFALTLALVYLAWRVITWVLIAAFFAAALNPAVEFLQRRGIRRGFAAAAVFFAALGAIAVLASLLVPPLVEQVRKFVDALPEIVADITAGRGPLGFLEQDYGIVERVREAIDERGAGGVLGATAPALAVAQGVVTAVIGAVTIAFLTLFMLLEGPQVIRRLLGLLQPRTRERWERVGHQVYRTVGGYVTGNLAISLIAGVVTTVVLFALGSDYAVALGLVVALLDLIPLAGATIAAVIVSAVVFVELGWVKGVVAIVFFLLYQQLENHILQPVIYGRTVQLSPLVVLVSVLIGAELAGVLGALAAIPLAGSLQAIGRELLVQRAESVGAVPARAAPIPPS
ncbi:MAG: AI-2E family transporter [Actinobacteria bacterium]|nr:AI-2E family transporter [Actinomycetota bacterium]